MDSQKTPGNPFLIPYQLVIGIMAALIVLLAIVLWAIQGTGSGVNESTNRQRPAATAQTGLVNINTATLDELMAVPGIGPKTANRILERRVTEPFKSVKELMKIRGVTMPNYELMKENISVR